jgi:predicted enzyme related to lactoylglutathione lyase
MTMSPKLFRIILPVSDITQAERFYSKLLGIPGKRVSPGRHYFDCEGIILACFDAKADGDSEIPQGERGTHYFAVKDLDAAFERARSAGCSSIEDEIQKRPWGERSFYARDPFENPICFVDESTVFSG